MHKNNIHKDIIEIELHCSAHFDTIEDGSGSFRRIKEPCIRRNPQTWHYYLGKNRYGIHVYQCSHCAQIWYDRSNFASEGFYD